MEWSCIEYQAMEISDGFLELQGTLVSEQLGIEISWIDYWATEMADGIFELKFSSLS